jgi:hypothetical protein
VPPHQLPRRDPIPATVGGTVRRGRCQSCDAASPAPVRLTRRALEGGPATPSIRFSCDPAGLGGGARPVGRHPCHAGRCGNNSSTVGRAGMGRRLTCHCAPYGPTSAAPSSPSEDIAVVRCSSTLEAATVRVRDTP